MTVTVERITEQLRAVTALPPPAPPSGAGLQPNPRQDGARRDE